MTCQERKDLILMHAAGALEGDEQALLRAHLATGCPQCAGALAEAEAALAQVSASLDPVAPPAAVKDRLLAKIASADASSDTLRPSMKMTPQRGQSGGQWDRTVLTSALAAVLAVAVTLAAVWKFRPAPASNPGSDKTVALLTGLLRQNENALKLSEDRINDLQTRLTAATQRSGPLDSMKFAELTGPAQPQALGRVFIDLDKSQWYFFTSGMKPAAQGKTYELWLIAGDDKIPAGTFDVGEHGNAQLLGTVPKLPAGVQVQLAVTDEPTGGTTRPSGSAQIAGAVK